MRKGRGGEGRRTDMGKLLKIIEGEDRRFLPCPPPPFQVLPAAWVEQYKLSGAGPLGN